MYDKCKFTILKCTAQKSFFYLRTLEQDCFKTFEPPVLHVAYTYNPAKYGPEIPLGIGIWYRTNNQHTHKQSKQTDRLTDTRALAYLGGEGYWAMAPLADQDH